MLDYYSFKNEFVTRCRERLSGSVGGGTAGDIIIEERPVTKAQLGELTGLIFRASGSNCAPTVYIEDFYRSYRNGFSVDELSIAAVNKMLRYIGNTPELSEDDLEDPANLRVRLLNRSRNTVFLKDVPYMDTGCGLALITEISSGEFRAVVTHDLLDSLGMSEEELFEAALENSSADEPAVLYSLTEMLDEGHDSCRNYLESGPAITAGALPQDVLYMLSNKSCFRGAAVLFYPGMAAKLNALLKGAFYVLPSSVHELLLLPVSEGDPQRLAAIIGSANRTVVNEEDYLSDDLYVCEGGVVRRVSYGSFVPEPGTLPN